MKALTAQRLREVLHYDATSGVFTWNQNTGSKQSGEIAGTPHNGRYIRIQVDGHLYRAHRLAWLYMTGEWPDTEIDHKNTTGTDNSWDNLRQASHFTNMQNQRQAHATSRTGYLGTHPQGNKYRARLWSGGRNVSLGMFDTPKEAHAAYLKAKRAMHAGCTI